MAESVSVVFLVICLACCVANVLMLRVNIERGDAAGVTFGVVALAVCAIGVALNALALVS